jgi:hypothetical protein
MQAALDGAIHHGMVHYIQPILIQVLKVQLRWEIQFAVRPGIMDRLTQGRKWRPKRYSSPCSLSWSLSLGMSAIS